MSGDHAAIRRWREREALRATLAAKRARGLAGDGGRWTMRKRPAACAAMRNENNDGNVPGRFRRLTR